MDLRRQIAIIRAWFPLLVVSVLFAASAAFFVGNLLPKVYEAKATLIVGQSLSAVSPDYSQLLVSQRLAATYASVATKRPILDSVIKRLGLAVTSDQLLKRVRADAPLESTLLTLSAQDADPDRAAAIANALAEQLIAASPAIQGRQVEFQASIDADLKATQAQIDATQTRVEALVSLTNRTAALDAELATLEGRLVSLRSTYATLLSFSSGNAPNLLNVVEPAVAPITPASSNPLVNTLLAAILGLMIAAGFISIVEYLDDTVKNSDAVQETANMPTLGTIARMKGDRHRSEIYRLATILYPRSNVAEAYRTLRTNIEFASVDAPIHSLLVTSSIPGEGKTVTAANVAVVFAQAGHQVLLVDADLRKPGVHLVFNLPNVHGLTTLLRSDEVSLDGIAQRTEQANLRIITTGQLPPNPAELMGSDRMRSVLARLQADADLVVFDSPPLQAVTDAAILSSFLDGTLFVIGAGHTRRPAVRLARQTLDRASAKVLGAVLNRTKVSANADFADYYGDSYGSDVGTEKRVRGTDEPPRRTAS